MTDDKKHDDQEAKKVEDEQLKDVAGGAYSRTNSRGQTYYLHSKDVQLRSVGKDGSGDTEQIAPDVKGD
jgi:hypothetical protein